MSPQVHSTQNRPNSCSKRFQRSTAWGSTLVMVTHDAFAASWCSRIIFIRDGALYGQIQRGALNRTQFFETIVAATTQMESEAANAR